MVVIVPLWAENQFTGSSACPDTKQRPEMNAILDIVCESFDKKDNSCLIEKINKKRMKKGNFIFPFKVF